MRLGCWMSGSGQNTSAWVKFSKLPSAKAFHQLLETACAALGLSTRPEGIGRERGRMEMSLTAFIHAVYHTSPCPSVWQRRKGRAVPSGTWLLLDLPSPPCGLALPRLCPVAPLACSLVLWLPWFV